MSLEVFIILQHSGSTVENDLIFSFFE